MTDELMSPVKAAALADCHSDTIRRAVEAGFIPAQRVGNTWVMKRQDVEAWVEAGRPNHRRSVIRELQEAGENPSSDAKPRKYRRKS
jgi:excisionase family DNA binding protein